MNESDAAFEALAIAAQGALPVWILALVAMATLPILLALREKAGPGAPTPADGGGTTGQLPEALRYVELMGKGYPVILESGLVVSEKTHIETQQTTTVSAGGAYMVGQQAYASPTTVTTSTSSTRKDTLFVRTVEGREKVWRLSGASFESRPGQILSSITRKGRGDFLLLYNHATGQIEGFGAIGAANRTGKWLPWAMSTLVGTLGYIWGLSILRQNFLRSNPEFASSMPMAPWNAQTWIMGFCAAAIISWILVGLVGLIFGMLRNLHFKSHYKPQFLRFLEESTPALGKVFASP